MHRAILIVYRCTFHDNELTVRILVIDDHAVVREGLRRAISRQSELSVVGEAASHREAIAQISHHNPDVIIVDIHLPDGSGLDIISWARSLSQRIGIVALTMSDLPEHVLACMESGASAHVDKAAPLPELIRAIQLSVTSPLTFTARKFPDAIGKKNEKIGLTLRELEILEKLPTGSTVAELAKQLFISESTIKTHLGAIYRKLQAGNRVQAINNARRAGLLP